VTQVTFTLLASEILIRALPAKVPTLPVALQVATGYLPECPPHKIALMFTRTWKAYV
jgi:hypothetical protein